MFSAWVVTTLHPSFNLAHAHLSHSQQESSPVVWNVCMQSDLCVCCVYRCVAVFRLRYQFSNKPYHSTSSVQNSLKPCKLKETMYHTNCQGNICNIRSGFELTFRHRASSVLDRYFATLPRTPFIYLINKYISLSDICLTVHH